MCGNILRHSADIIQNPSHLRKSQLCGLMQLEVVRKRIYVGAKIAYVKIEHGLCGRSLEVLTNWATHRRKEDGL